ncbi:putative TPR domain-containing protein [Alphaproteobacteria bacterium]
MKLLHYGSKMSWIGDKLLRKKDALKGYVSLFKGWIGALRNKLRNLSQTNLDLALYHLGHGNINDAIFRLNLLRLFRLPINEIDYYLGRCYVEKFKFQCAVKYLQIYLNTPPPLKLQQEAQYCLKIATNNPQDITEIPSSIIIHKFNQIADRYNKLFFNDQPDAPQAVLVKLLQQTLTNSLKPFGNHILDLGCGTGIMGLLCRQNRIIDNMIGVDITPKMLQQAQELTFENSKVYNQLYLQDIGQYLTQTAAVLRSKYDIIIASNIITYYARIDLLFSASHTISSDSGILVLVFKNTLNPSLQRQFMDKIEQFYYSPQYVKELAEQHKWLFVSEQVVTFFTKEIATILILSKQSLQVIKQPEEDADGGREKEVAVKL